MIDNDTLVRLRSMRLSGMTECFERLVEQVDQTGLLTPQVVQMAVDFEYERRRNSKLARLRRRANLAQPAADVGDIRMLPGRSVDSEFIARLAVGTYLLKHQDVVLQGPTGVGKTYVACALGNKACQQGHTVLYLSASELFDQLRLGERIGDT